MLALQRVDEIVEKDHSSAYILDCYGIEFYECPDKMLADVCLKKGIDPIHVCEHLNTNHQNSVNLDQLRSYPIDLIIEYLKHAHHIFLKKSLPYMGKLIQRLDEEKYQFPDLIKDLKFVFPLFMEDFIHHIYEEEDEVFVYINDLQKVLNKRTPFTRVFSQMEELSLAEIMVDHEDADDEMKGIRRITHNYSYGIDTDLHLRTIYRELQHFERQLVFHATVENEVLFPKAIDLEVQVKKNIKAGIPMN